MYGFRNSKNIFSLIMMNFKAHQLKPAFHGPKNKILQK